MQTRDRFGQQRIENAFYAKTLRDVQNSRLSDKVPKQLALFVLKISDRFCVLPGVQ